MSEKKPKSKRRATYYKEPNRISLEEAKAADANVIMAQYRRNGTLPVVHNRIPLYGDFTGPQDLHTALERSQEALERFQELPASVRLSCDNDPVRFLEMFDDPDERVMLEDAGLVISGDAPSSPEPNPVHNSPHTPADAQATPSAKQESTDQSEASEGGSGG